MSYSESPAFAGVIPDATTDRQARDLPLLFPITRTGISCVGTQYARGAFKYLTIHMPKDPSSPEGFWHDGIAQRRRRGSGTLGHLQALSQKFLGRGKFGIAAPRISLKHIWINCTAFPSNSNPRAYTGYFHSSSTVLNRIWYAGAYTLQLSTIDPNEGSALIDYNRNIDHNHSPVGSWYSNFTIANGTAVTTDGAKRDRMVWPGDMSIAIPGIAVSTYDLVAVRNALDTLFDHQYSDGSLPYAGPPMGYGGEFSDTYHLHTLLGVWQYILFSNDLPWLRRRWAAYLEALEVSIAKVDETGLLHVTSTSDWLRPGMTGHNLEVSAILYEVINKTVELAVILQDDGAKANIQRWQATNHRLRNGSERLYCSLAGMYGDNIGRRGCGGAEEVLPQDGNSWALLSHLVTGQRAANISSNLRKRWTKYGAPATEFPNVISPFASSFELQAHCAAGNHDAAIELIEMMWGHMLDGAGFTNSTLAEGYRVDGDAQYPAYWSSARNSHAHGWSTGPTMVLLTQVLGIELLTPLGRTWHIEPHLTKWLTHIRGGFATRLGNFEVVVKSMKDLSGGKVEVLQVETPKHSSGTIVCGGQELRSVRGGRRQWVRLTTDVYANSGNSHWQELDENWDDGQFVQDDTWQAPPRQERAAGIVDWEAMSHYYM